MESLSGAIEQVKNAMTMDEEVVNECLNKIARALRQSDVRIKLVHDMKTNIKKLLDDVGRNKKQIIFLRAIFDELCKMLDHPGKLSFTPNKGNPTVVMFVGPQGSGKTTTCTKYAYYHKNKGWKPALVCSDTSSAAAFHQLKQNATSTNIPFYGSCMESDPVKIAVEGVETFKKDNCDLIVVDTSAYLIIEDIRQVYEATKPDLVILVLDSSVPHAALYQAQAFSQSVALGAVILTKMDCHAKGCGALSAVATSKNPVIFLGTGKLMDEFESFDVRSFVSHLLGEDDPPGFMDKNHEFVSMGQQLESLKKLSEENCTLRIMNEQYQKMEVVLAALSICQLPPGVMPDGRPKRRLAHIKKYMRIMDYMTDEELDSTNPNHMNESRMMQIAEASNLHMNEVLRMFEEYRRFANIWNVIKGLQFHKKEDMRLLIQYMNALQEKMVIPPQLLRVRGDELQKLLKQMECSLVAMVLEQEDA